MSKYTTQVRFICEVNSGLDESVGYDNISQVIANSRAKIFDFSYPIFDENYRATLETKILKHYYTREIGLETVGLWKHFLDMRMNEIMPYYNKLYESELIEFDPFNDVDYTREGNRTDKSNGNDKMTGTVGDVGNSTSEDGGEDNRSGSSTPKKSTWDLYSDTPQGGIAGIEAAEASVGSNAYLTNARHVIEDGTGSTTSEKIEYGRTNESNNTNTRTYNTNNARTTEGEGEYYERVKGKMGNRSYAKLIQELRETFLNIDMRIIEDLSDLFMNVY